VRPTDRRPFYTLLGGIAVAAVVFIGWQMSQAKSSGVITIDPNIPLPDATGYLMGSPTAPVQILEFADFECPAWAFTTMTRRYDALSRREAASGSRLPAGDARTRGTRRLPPRARMSREVLGVHGRSLLPGPMGCHGDHRPKAIFSRLSRWRSEGKWKSATTAEIQANIAASQ
jgi:hypothetical protein